LIELDDAMIAVKERKHQTKSTDQYHGCWCGYWRQQGTLIGLIFLMPLAGAAHSAASGTQRIFNGCRHQRQMDERDRCHRSARNPALFVLVRKSRQTRFLSSAKAAWC
jgi:uncharacterized membrane protein